MPLKSKLLEISKKAFPYKAPNKFIKMRYSYLFSSNCEIPNRYLKFSFDKLVSLFFLVFFSFFIFIIYIIYLIEGIIIPENKGPLFFSYKAVSKGKIFNKYKLRIIKTKYIDSELAKKGDWSAYSLEWLDECRTFTGSLIKKFYLDEIPQFFNVLKGDMSIIGPRPLSLMHYEKDLSQGNVSRKLVKGGLLGLGHIHKGKPDFGNPIYEYEYIDQYIKRSELSLLFFDLTIIFRGILLIIKGGGH